MLSGGVEVQNPKAAVWIVKWHINLDADILVARGTGARKALAWHHNLQELILGVSCGLKVSEKVLIEQRNTEETDDVPASGSSKDVSNSGVLMESMRMEYKPCSKAAAAWSRKK